MVDLAQLAGISGGKNEQLIFRNFSVYIQGAKCGLARKAVIDLTMIGGQDYYELGQFIGTSWGPVKSSCSIDNFVPESGRAYQQRVLRALQEGKYVFVSAGEIGKRFIQLGWMVVRSIRTDGDLVRGSTSMDITLEGGSPDILESTTAIPLRFATQPTV